MGKTKILVNYSWEYDELIKCLMEQGYKWASGDSLDQIEPPKYRIPLILLLDQPNKNVMWQNVTWLAWADYQQFYHEKDDDEKIWYVQGYLDKAYDNIEDQDVNKIQVLYEGFRVND